MSDERFNRLETKVDKVNDKVEDVEKSVIKIESKMDNHMEMVKDHVSADTKITAILIPLIPHLEAMTEDYAFQKKMEEDKAAKRKDIGDKIKFAMLWLALPGALLTGLSSLFSFF